MSQPRSTKPSAFFAGGTSPKAPRFGATKTVGRPFTPGMTREELAQKRAEEAARQKDIFTPKRGLGTADEPRTSFSDDMGKAFDNIGLAASKPLPESMPPSMPVTPQKPRPAQGNGNGAREASALGNAIKVDTEPSSSNLAPANIAGAPSVRQVSNPVKDVTALDFDGTDVFFIDNGAQLPDDDALFGGAGSKAVNLDASPHVVNIEAAPNMRNRSLKDVDANPSQMGYSAQQLAPEQPRGDSHPPPAQLGYAAQQSATSEQRHGHSQLPSSALGYSAHQLLSSEPPVGDSVVSSATPRTDSHQFASEQARMDSHLLSSEPEASHIPSEPQQPSTFPTTSSTTDTPSTPPIGASRDVKESFSADAYGGARPPSQPETTQQDNAQPASGVGGYAPTTLGAIGGAAAATVAVVGGAAAAAASTVGKTTGLSPKITRDEPGGAGSPADTLGEAARTQQLHSTSDTLPTSGAQREAPRGPSPDIHPAPPAPTHTGATSARQIPRASAVPDVFDSQPGTPGAGTPGASTPAAVPEPTVDPASTQNFGVQRAPSAVPDDLDPTCLPRENAEGARQVSPSHDSRKMSPSAASAVPDDYDKSAPPPGALPHSYSVDSIPPINQPGAAPTSDLDQGNPAGVVREADYEAATTSPVLGPTGHAVELAPTTEVLSSELSSASSDPSNSDMALGAGAAGAAVGAAAYGMSSFPESPTSLTSTGLSPRMPEERSMSAASVVAIKDGRAGMVPNVKTSNLVCEAAPKTGDTFGTSVSATPSECSLVGDETRRGQDPATSTASITAIRGGNEGTAPSPPGRSPLSASRTAETEFIDGADDEQRDAGRGERELEAGLAGHERGVGSDDGESHRGQGFAAGAAGLAAATGGAALAASSGRGRDAHSIDQPAEREHDSAAHDLEPSPLDHNNRPTTEEGQDADADPRNGEQLHDVEQHGGPATVIQSSTARREGAVSSASNPDEPYHTPSTSSPATNSFMSAGTPLDEATPMARTGTGTPLVPGDYMSASTGGRTEAATPLVPGDYMSAEATSGGSADEAERKAGDEVPSAMGTADPESRPAAQASELASEGDEAANGSETPVVATTAEPTETLAEPTAGPSGEAGTANGADSGNSTPSKIERKPVPPVPPMDGKPSAPPLPLKPAGHNRTDSKSSVGSARKMGFMSKLKGEIKVISGKFGKNKG